MTAGTILRARRQCPSAGLLYAILGLIGIFHEMKGHPIEVIEMA
jgi:hypothetical protein